MNRNAFASGFKNEVVAYEKKSYDGFLMQAYPEDIKILLWTGVPLLYIMTNDVEKMVQEIRSTVLGGLKQTNRLGRDQRTTSYFEWSREDNKLSHWPDITYTLFKPTSQDMTLENSLNFLSSNFPWRKDCDADSFVIVYRAADIFKDKSACEEMAKIIVNNDNENARMRKEFILIGSEPYIPSAFKGIVTCLRRDFNIDTKAAEVRPVDLDEVWSAMVHLFDIKNIDIRSKELWCKNAIKDLTQREAEDILFYLLDKDSDLIPSRLSKCIDDLQLKKQLFQFIG